MDETFRKLLHPQDPRGPRGRLARGNNIYRGVSTSPTPVGVNSRTQRKSLSSDIWTRLAQMRMKGII